MGWDFIQNMVLSLDALLHPLCFLCLYYPNRGQTDRLVVPCLPRSDLASMDGNVHGSFFECVPPHYSSYRWKIGFESDAGISWAEIDGKLHFHGSKFF
jgi:hypothetical protein